METEMRGSFGWRLVLLELCAVSIAAGGSMDWEQARRFAAQAEPAPWTKDIVSAHISDWPEIPRLEAGKIMDKYGLPDEITANSLVWKEREDWSRVALYRNEDFAHRSGVLEQSIDYAVPMDRWRDLNALDIGVSYVPEEEILVASSESEEINTLALNIVVDVVKGRRQVEVARNFYRRTLDLALSGKSSRYTRGLLFSPERHRTTRRPPWPQQLRP